MAKGKGTYGKKVGHSPKKVSSLAGGIPHQIYLGMRRFIDLKPRHLTHYRPYIFIN